MSKDHYKTLGVDKSASKEEIKRAFHKMAHKYHPDKNKGDDAKFKEVNEAYQVLSDDQKRSRYNQFGNADMGDFSAPDGPASGWGGFDFSGFQNAGGFSSQDFDIGDLGDIFGDFFGGGIGRNQRRVKKGRDISTELDISFEEAVFGTTKNISISGAGIFKKSEEIKITIPAGIKNGQTLKMSGMGESIKDGQTGNLYIKINVRPHNIFKRDGANLTMDLPIKLSDALLGAIYPLKTLDGNIEVKIPEGINHGELLRVRGKGIPQGSYHRGDIIIRILIKMPTRLSRQAKEAIQKLKEEGL